MGRLIGLAAAGGLALAAFAAAAAPVPGPAREITDPKSVVSETREGAGPVPVADLYFSRGVGDAVWTPDGKSVVLSTNLTGRFNLWRVDAAGGWPVQLTRSDDRQAGVAISPDGKWVVFQSDVGGGEVWDLYATPVAGGPVVNLTNTPDVSETSAEFSPDGRMLAFSRKLKSQAQDELAVMDFATRQVRTLSKDTPPEQNWSVVDWMPDGAGVIANRENVNGAQASVWRFEAASGAAKSLTPTTAASKIDASDLSPDGRWLAVTTLGKDGQDQAGLLDVATGQVKPIAATPWEQAPGAFSPDGRRMVFRTNENGRLDLAAVDVASGTVTRLDVPPGLNRLATGGGSPFARDGRLLISHAGSNTPVDLWILDPAGKTSRLTTLALASLDSSRLPTSRIVNYKSEDGTVISAILLMPFNLKRDGTAPGVVLPHGGPAGQSLDSFSATAVALASRGYVVIQPNFRGSTGYGMAFQKANHKDLGGGDLTDTVYAAKFLAATGYVDPKKTGITGGSYGGFMTLMAVGRTPDVWAAAVSQYGIINWYEMLKHEDARLQQYQRSLIGDPVADKAVYDASSPMTYIRKAKAPLLVLQGENDIRVPRGQAAEVVQTLKDVGATVDVKYYPEEGHGFVKRENQIDALQRTIDWFDRYLKGAK